MVLNPREPTLRPEHGENMKKALMMVVLAAFVGSWAGCKEKGPMEKAGEKIDNAARETKDATKEAWKDTTNSVSKSTR